MSFSSNTFCVLLTPSPKELASINNILSFLPLPLSKKIKALGIAVPKNILSGSCTTQSIIFCSIISFLMPKSASFELVNAPFDITNPAFPASLR